MNSGIKPYLIKSSGSRDFIISDNGVSLLAFTLALNPMDVPLHSLISIIFSRPANAPPHINKIFVVSTCKNFVADVFYHLEVEH